MAGTETEIYPTIKFFLRNGKLFAWAAGLLIAAYGIWGTVNGGNWACAVAGLGAGWFAYMVMRCCIEVLALVADTLMPQ